MMNEFKIGKISDIDEEKNMATVEIQDADKVNSHFLHILQTTTKDNQLYFMPQIDDIVLCLFMPNAFAKGFILGSFYTAKNASKMQNKDIFSIHFKDDTVIKYDFVNSLLTADIKGDVDIIVSKNLKAEVTENVDIKVGGNVSAEIAGNAEAKVDGDIKAEISGDAEIKASNVKITADSTLIECSDINLGANGGEAIVLESHPCFFTGAPHKTKVTAKVKAV